MKNNVLTYLREELTVVVDIVVFGISCFIALYCDLQIVGRDSQPVSQLQPVDLHVYRVMT